jgi:hypothetical protein
LQDATAGFRTDRMALVRETENGEEVLDLERLTGDEEMSPIFKLVYTVVLNALERAPLTSTSKLATRMSWSSIESTARSIVRPIRSTSLTIKRSFSVSK